MSEGLRLLRSVCEQGSSTTLRNLEDGLFIDADEREVYRFIRHHFRSYSEMPVPETVADETGVTLPQAPEHVQYYYDSVQDRRMFNAVRDPFNELRQALMSNSAEEARDAITDLQMQSRVHRSEQDVLRLREVGQDVMRHYQDNRLLTGLTGVPTGWSGFDEMSGGWQAGDANFIVARPNVGKTYVLLHSARAAWMAGFSVLVCSMEMTLRQLGYRFYGMHAGVNPELFRKAQLSFHAERRINEAVVQVDADRKFNMYAGNFKGKTTGEIEILAQELEPDVIFIDGVYLMNPENSPRSLGRVEKVGYVVDEIKQTALRTERPIVNTTQFGREAGKKGGKGTLENIGYSDAISTHGSIVMGIKPPDGDKSKHPKRRVLDIMKGREGEQGKFEINFTFAPMNLSQVAKGDETAPEDDEPEENSNNMDWMG